jgi:SAM-dependent methyltransferase
MTLDADDDPYLTDVHRWWHLSWPSPELVRALKDGWLGAPGRALDLGCGSGVDDGYLAGAGFLVTGIDLSAEALRRARTVHPGVRFARADATRLPFGDGSFNLLTDRGCLHYLAAAERPRYAEEAARVLRPGGRLFPRACLFSVGERNDIDEASLRRVFAGWTWLQVREQALASDTRVMPALVALLRRG